MLELTCLHRRNDIGIRFFTGITADYRCQANTPLMYRDVRTSREAGCRKRRMSVQDNFNLAPRVRFELTYVSLTVRSPTRWYTWEYKFCYTSWFPTPNARVYPEVLLYLPLRRKAVLKNDVTGPKPNQVLPHFRITKLNWCGNRDSNSDSLGGNQSCYRYTKPAV